MLNIEGHCGARVDAVPGADGTTGYDGEGERLEPGERAVEPCEEVDRAGLRHGDPLDVATVPEIASLLRVAAKTVYGMVERGELPGARRVGRTIRISRAAVLRWLSEGQGRVSRSRRMR